MGTETAPPVKLSQVPLMMIQYIPPRFSCKLHHSVHKYSYRTRSVVEVVILVYKALVYSYKLFIVCVIARLYVGKLLRVEGNRILVSIYSVY